MQYGNKKTLSREKPGYTGLNRTMQYGNCVLCIILIKYLHCLNRTMQYGNYINIKIIIIYKQSLNRTMQYGNFFFEANNPPKVSQFKSYYVVWKPLKKNSTDDASTKGLNRTMQYGNGYTNVGETQESTV